MKAGDNMDIIVLEKANDYPITLAEAKKHLRVLTDDEDELIEAYIDTATEYCETIQNKNYMTTKLKLILDEINLPIKLPRPPFQSLEKIEVQKSDGTLEEWPADNYIVDDSGYFGFINRSNSYNIPGDLAEQQKIQITYTAGYATAAEVPARVKNAIKLLTAHFWSVRAPVSTTGGVPQEINLTVKALLGTDRVVPV